MERRGRPRRSDKSHLRVDECSRETLHRSAANSSSSGSSLFSDVADALMHASQNKTITVLAVAAISSLPPFVTVCCSRYDVYPLSGLNRGIFQRFQSIRQPIDDDCTLSTCFTFNAVKIPNVWMGRLKRETRKRGTKLQGWKTREEACWTRKWYFNRFTRTRLRYFRVFAIANPSVVCLSVTLVHPIQGLKLSAIFLHRCVPLSMPIFSPLCKILRRSS